MLCCGLDITLRDFFNDDLFEILRRESNKQRQRRIRSDSGAPPAFAPEDDCDSRMTYSTLGLTGDPYSYYEPAPRQLPLWVTLWEVYRFPVSP